MKMEERNYREESKRNKDLPITGRKITSRRKKEKDEIGSN